MKAKTVWRLIANGAADHLNLPSGVGVAPLNFGEFSGALLVGNTGNGWINAFNSITGKFLGSLGEQLKTDRDQRPLGVGVRRR